MTIDWDNFQGELDDLVKQAGARTDNRLAGKVSGITRLTDEEVKRLFPDPADVKRLAELMEIVKRSGDANEKLNRIAGNIDQFGGIILTLLSKLA